MTFSRSVSKRRKERSKWPLNMWGFFVFLNVILNSRELVFIIYKVVASCPSKALLQNVCQLKAFYALFKDSTFLKIACLFLLFLDFSFSFGKKTKLFLEIASNENKDYRYSKQKIRIFYS